MTKQRGTIDDRVRAYLTQVQDVLSRDGVSADDIESVSNALENQIIDMAKNNGAATAESIEIAIASMDHPASFSSSADHTTASDDDSSDLLAKLAFTLSMLGPALAIVGGIIASLLGYPGWEFGSFILLAAASVALLFGLIARDNPGGRTAMKVSVGILLGYSLLFAVAVIFE